MERFCCLQVSCRGQPVATVSPNRIAGRYPSQRHMIGLEPNWGELPLTHAYSRRVDIRC